MTKATIVPFQPRPGHTRRVEPGLEAKIILFPGIRYERRDGEERSSGSEDPKGSGSRRPAAQ